MSVEIKGGGHPVDPENPPFGSREKMAHGRETAQVHEGSIPSCKHTLFSKRLYLNTNKAS